MQIANVVTDADCALNGGRIALADWASLSSDSLAQIVGIQSPSGIPEDASDYKWRFAFLDVKMLQFSAEDGDEPEGGWAGAYQRQLESDEAAVRGGSPEYAGRGYWLEYVWGIDTQIYPLYVVQDGDGFRLLDGHHRLAGAFHFGLKQVAILLGQKPSVPR